MKKINIIINWIIGIILFVSINIGLNKILIFDETGFFSLLATIGIILYIVFVINKEKILIVRNTLNIAEKIYSLDYTKLDNIRKIDISYNENGEYIYQVYLKNSQDLHFNILEQIIPESQEELNALDKQLEKMNKNK